MLGLAEIHNYYRLLYDLWTDLLLVPPRLAEIAIFILSISMLSVAATRVDILLFRFL
jgi:hypothetical protein